MVKKSRTGTGSVQKKRPRTDVVVVTRLSPCHGIGPLPDGIYTVRHGGASLQLRIPASDVPICWKMETTCSE
jgi:hypothetical protein